MEPSALSISQYFASVVDPRMDRTKAHPLLNIIIISLCAVICGADGWVEIEQFGRSKQAWLATFLDLTNGIPSHDTFGRVFARLDPSQFQQSFVDWVRAIQTVQPNVIAIDGKTHRRSHDRRNGKTALHLVSAWASENRLVLAQVAVDSKSNEITAIPQLLNLLDLRGSTVTLDALGTQTTIATQIIAGGGQYVLALKDNHPILAADVVNLFADAQTHPADAGMQTARQVTKGHGRLETRTAHVIHDPATIQYLNERQHWSQLMGVALIQTERTLNGTTRSDQRYYLLSQAWDAAAVNHLVRTHWGIENSVHWVLDVVFHEDASRIRMGNAPQNLAVGRHIALNRVRHEPSKGSIKTKRFRAALDERFLASILGIQ